MPFYIYDFWVENAKAKILCLFWLLNETCCCFCSCVCCLLTLVLPSLIPFWCQTEHTRLCTACSSSFKNGLLQCYVARELFYEFVSIFSRLNSADAMSARARFALKHGPFGSGWFKFTWKRLNTVCYNFFFVWFLFSCAYFGFLCVLLCRDLSRHCVLLM